jgi:hypothetical protein
MSKITDVADDDDSPPALFLPRPHEQLRDDNISIEAARD